MENLEFEKKVAKTDKYTISHSMPRMENGDRLNRFDFERRYSQMPHVKKAELVEGVVYMPSPVRIASHAEPHADVITWLGCYRAATPHVALGDNATVRLDLENEPQPDALLRIDEVCGGHSRISADDYVEGAPELIVEVASSTASYDLHDKLRAYQRNGVREYLVWLVGETEFRWHEIVEGVYRRRQPDAEGILESVSFPGLRLDVGALLNGDMRRVLSVLQHGIESDAHQAFIAKLQQTGRTAPR